MIKNGTPGKQSHHGTFERNGWYEHLESQIQAGKLKLESLSIPTRLALAEYLKQRRFADALK